MMALLGDSTLASKLKQMSSRFLLYYITDRSAFARDEHERRRRLLEKIAEAARLGVDFIQLREKDLCGRDLELMAREAIRIIGENSNGVVRTTLLINSRTDVALATGAAGVHLRGGDVSVADVRAAWSLAGGKLADPVISVSCHSLAEVNHAASDRASMAVFAPVFEKKDSPGSTAAGLDGLQLVCRVNIPVLALGGVNAENAEACRRAGAAGIAGIRLFQENDLGVVVRKTRG
jgi:thiamine-phosphate pyrophosphorylase